MKDSTYSNSPILMILVVASVLMIGWPVLIPLLCLRALVLGPTLLLAAVAHHVIRYELGD